MTQESILVVDDEAAMRKLLTSNLKLGGYTVHAAADGTEALQLIDEHPFDLLLVDVNIPGPNGFEVLESVRRTADTPVLIVSGRSCERDKVHALDLGADDYLVKPFGIPEMLARVKALLRRASHGPKGPVPTYRYHGLEVDFAARRARLHGVNVPLTALQYEVLAYLARNAGKIVLHRQVLQAVWGGQYGDEANYVWTVVQRIRLKIEPDRTARRYLLTEPGGGYSLPPPNDATSCEGRG